MQRNYKCSFKKFTRMNRVQSTASNWMQLLFIKIFKNAEHFESVSGFQICRTLNLYFFLILQNKSLIRRNNVEMFKNAYQ